MQLSNALNSYCVNESINSDNTDLVDLNNKRLTLKSVLSLFTLLLKHLLFKLLNSKSVLSQLRILSFNDLNNKCLNGGFNSDHNDIGDLNNKCLNESIFNNDKTNFDYLNYKCI
jgi:hypothetical protein